MTTYDQVYTSLDLKQIEKTSVSINKMILNVARFVATPIIIYDNIIRFRKYLAFKKDMEQMKLALAKDFSEANDFEKADIYASIKYNYETIEEIYSKTYLNPISSGFILRLTGSVVKKIVKTFEELEQEYYLKTYPNNPDPNDPVFIKKVLDAHTNPAPQLELY